MGIHANKDPLNSAATNIRIEDWDDPAKLRDALVKEVLHRQELERELVDMMREMGQESHGCAVCGGDPYSEIKSLRERLDGFLFFKEGSIEAKEFIEKLGGKSL